MTLAALAQRLARVEHARAARDPAGIPRAAVVYVSPGEDVAPRVAALVERGEHRRGCPVLAIRVDWLAVRAMGGTGP